MVHAATITISPEGNISLPKEFRDVLGSDVVTLEVGKYNDVILYPLRDVGGAFREYAKDTDPPFKEVRRIALTKALARYKP